MRAICAADGIDEPRAAQAFERPRLSHPHHVLTLRSALVDRAAQNVIYSTNIINVDRAADVLLDASTWPGHDLQVGRAEDAQEKQEKRRSIELVQRSSGHMYCMCSEERIF